MINAMDLIDSTQFHLPCQTGFYKGKVRDVYSIGNDMLAMVASDRISAFDVVLPRAIPFKGQVLNQLAAFMLKATASEVPNWFIASPDPNVTVGKRCAPFKVEMVIRGYLAGHAARTYHSGLRSICGVRLPEGMRANDPFPEPIITPTTKADEGHDIDISRDEILSGGWVSEEHYALMEKYSYALFKLGREMASKRGLILVDTKYEFGLCNGEVMLMDEVHTPDSSRYFYLDSYERLQSEGKSQLQLSKEFVREWLIANGFSGREGQTVPAMSDEFVQEISHRYIELYEKITGMNFVRRDYTNVEHTILESLLPFCNS
jgi:phosphoribosylaminoimidazole-succinocarboxamide synthase